mmetsp:Transcript_43592/g.48490  ORF Transcript_43592/g.48490 Transcript_43592/m.48490 type:complete len:89 (-) Transcript_43592:118-384(-)
MTIVTWTDSDQEYSSDYKSKMIKLKKRSPTLQYRNIKPAPGYHYYRQEEFYHMCSKHLLEQNKTWVCTYCISQKGIQKPKNQDTFYID